MEKAYDIKSLVEKLKDKGLDVAEDGAAVAVSSVIEWLSESAMLSESPYDNILLAVYPIVKGKALDMVDKIDGVDDGVN